MIEATGIRKYLPLIFKTVFVVIALMLMYIPVFVIIYQSFNSDANAMQALHFGKFTFKIIRKFLQMLNCIVIF